MILKISKKTLGKNLSKSILKKVLMNFEPIL